MSIPNKNLLIIYAGHTSDGSTATLADWIKTGAETVAGLDVNVKMASTVTPTDISAANGIICGSGDYNGNPEPDMINFFDNTLQGGFNSKFSNLTTMPFGVFATSAGYATGVQEVMQSMARSLLTFGCIYVGGGNWHTSQGIAGMTYTLPICPTGSTGGIPCHTTGSNTPTWDWVQKYKGGIQQYIEEDANCYGRRIALATISFADGFYNAIDKNPSPTPTPTSDYSRCDPKKTSQSQNIQPLKQTDKKKNKKMTEIDKWMFCFRSALIFIIIASPFMFKLTSPIFATMKLNIQRDGCPNWIGIIIHSIIFAILIRLSMLIPLHGT
jgi:multimeric flavodoxin WrbA